MIFAELQTKAHGWEFHQELADFLASRFENTRSGLQSDSWVWILEGDGQKVAVDTFTCRNHQVKAPERSCLLDQVLAALQERYPLALMDPPQLEGHEEPLDFL